MKRFFIIIVLILIVLFTGCNFNQETIPEISTTPPVSDNNNQIEDEEQEEKKKCYAVSTVNSLRIRNEANTSGGVVGYLDKNDAVLIISEKDDFYETVYKEKSAFISKKYCKVMEIDSVGEKEEKAIELGASLLGYPYVWGSQRYHWGNGKLNTAFVNGEFDCSAFVQYIFYKSNGAILDLTTRTQVYNGTEVKRENLSRGNLMFFTNQSRQYKTGVERIGHVGIYLGNNYILHTASDHAVIEPISELRWSYYVTARKVV